MSQILSTCIVLAVRVWHSCLSTLRLVRLHPELGAYSIVNRNYAYFPSSFLPAASHTFADLTMVSGTVTSSTFDTGVAGLQWVRVRALVKDLTGVDVDDIVQVTVRAGTGAALTNPGIIAQCEARKKTGDTYIALMALGWSNAGFRSYQVIVDTPTSSGVSTAITDVEVSAA